MEEGGVEEEVEEEEEEVAVGSILEEKSTCIGGVRLPLVPI